MMAMPLGSVVLATRVGDLPYNIEDGITGFLADPDVFSLTQKISYALSDFVDLEHIRHNSIKRAKQEFNWGKIAKQVNKVYWDL